MADDPGRLGDPEETLVEPAVHAAAHQACPELDQTHMRDPAVLQRQPQGRLPRQVEPRPPLGFPVRHPIEQLRQQQSGQHRWRVRRPAPPRRVQAIEVGVVEQRPARHAQRRQETILIKKIAAHHLDMRQRPLRLSRSSHDAQ